MSESAAVLSSCYVSDSLMNYVLYTLHTNPVPTSPGRGDSTLAGVSSAPGTLPGGHTIIHALLMLYKTCSLYFGCCDADPSIHVSLQPFLAWWMTTVPCACPGKAGSPALPGISTTSHQRSGLSLLSGNPQLCPHGCRRLQLNAENKVGPHGASP